MYSHGLETADILKVQILHTRFQFHTYFVLAVAFAPGVAHE